MADVLTDYIGFGIPSLDRLIGDVPSIRSGRRTPTDPTPVDELGLCLRPKSSEEKGGASKRGKNGSDRDRTGEATTFCVIGPDGTGKSLLALHLASDYWRRTRLVSAQRPKVIYVSTDLSKERATVVWKAFWLNRPVLRPKYVPFEKDWLRVGKVPVKKDNDEFDDTDKNPDVELRAYQPLNEPEVFARLISDPAEDNDPAVAFLDLEASTTGDDWGFLHTLLSSLPPPVGGSLPHLLVIDAVEGLEVLVGERDAFGEPQSRRGRIAQLIRAASRKCHLVFVVEELADGVRLPEVFVSDVVVRCRASSDRDYRRRTVEIEKVRGQAHVRGEHEFRVRQEGSYTGDRPNPDDPVVGRVVPGKEGLELERMAYIQVFPSFHQLSNTDAKLKPPLGGQRERVLSDPREWRYASFGIYQADAMLASARNPLGNELAGVSNNTAGFDEMGLPAGSITALIGNESTHKSKLARAFLAQSFRTRHDVRPNTRNETMQLLNRDDLLLGQGAAILICTYPISQTELVGKLKYHLIQADESVPNHPTQEEGLEERLIVRQLPNHYLPAAALAHIVREAVAEAERLLKYRYTKTTTNPPPLLNARIRLVIDDWTSLLSMYPEIARDPLALPYLINFLRLKGVTSLVLATRSGHPADRITESADREGHDLQLLTDHHLFTWHVPFYGERRVAVTALPSLNADDTQLVRELRPGRLSELPKKRIASGAGTAAAQTTRGRVDSADEIDPEALVVDPHFELYRDLDEGHPTPVTLQVQLYAEKEDAPATKANLAEVQELLRQVFGRNAGQAVVFPHYGDTYERLRELSYLQSEAKLDHTLVLQVDEFWAESRSELRRQERYLRARTVDRGGQPIRFEDPFQLFGLTAAARDIFKERKEKQNQAWEQGPLQRQEFFDTIGYKYSSVEKQFPIYKVPYTWDFGFLLCNRTAWKRAEKVYDHRTRVMQRKGRRWEYDKQTVGDVWNRLQKAGKQASPGKEPLSWREFLGACVTVAKHTRFEYVPFDLDLFTSESFSCLVFEVWMSEVYRAATAPSGNGKKRMAYRLAADFLKGFNNPNKNPWVPRTRREQASGKKMNELLGSADDDPQPGLYRRALYRTLLLLDEVFSPVQLPDEKLVLRPRPAAPNAVASRQWYSTATNALHAAADRRVVQVAGLPGHFSARGDWFLAIARGSRSPRLGERVIDLLCSRRGNIHRLQSGTGLPVRMLANDPRDDRYQRVEFRTALPHTLDDEREEAIHYHELRQLGAFDEFDQMGRNEFFWFWRSTISSYDYQAHVWQKWLTAVVRQWRQWPRPNVPELDKLPPGFTVTPGLPWWDGFREYDCYRVLDLEGEQNELCHVETKNNPRWDEFDRFCDALVEALNRASDVISTQTN